MPTNQQLPDELVLTHNHAGKAFLQIEHPAVRALIALEGAHLVSCIPAGQSDLLWMSPVDTQAPGGVLRGGVPLCWPWFGSARSGPAHGIARRNRWQLDQADTDQQGVRLRFSLPTATIRSALPDESWALSFEVSLGATLHMALTTRNTGQTAQPLSQALHSYLPVSDITQVRVEGLAGARYLDQLSGKMQRQQGALRIDQEVDRVYLDHREPLYLHDGDRILEVRRSGSASVVLWNPWRDKSTRLDNFPAEGYRQMLCIEAANADADTRQLEPGEQHTLTCEVCQIAGK